MFVDSKQLLPYCFVQRNGMLKI